VIGLSIFVLLICIGVLGLGWLLADLLSGDQRRAAEATKAALPVLAGAVGLPLIVWRLLILDQQTKISEAKTQIDRETHYTSIFARAIEQLGQTREVKRTVQSEAGKEETTTTVPNIEVRLGGIHALARLAEESARDRDKIGNILRAYIRENSWSGRAGDLITKPTWDPASAWTWSRYPHSQVPQRETRTAKDAWIEAITKQVKELDAWSINVPETRVDVNEAADIGRYARDDASTQMVLDDCMIVRCKVRSLRLSPDSEIGFGPIPEIAFEGTDLGAVVNFDPETLDSATATANTTHPAGSPRPKSWPPYSANR
jgi:hypothetical protein